MSLPVNFKGRRKAHPLRLTEVKKPPGQLFGNVLRDFRLIPLGKRRFRQPLPQLLLKLPALLHPQNSLQNLPGAGRRPVRLIKGLQITQKYTAAVQADPIGQHVFLHIPAAAQRPFNVLPSEKFGHVLLLLLRVAPRIFHIFVEILIHGKKSRGVFLLQFGTSFKTDLSQPAVKQLIAPHDCLL